jgi:conserved oligomeric Golgi complex subunit 6
MEVSLETLGVSQMFVYSSLPNIKANNKQQLNQVGFMIANLNRCVASMKAHVGAAYREIGPVLEEADVLLQQKNETETKQQLLTAFNKHFTLSDDEHNTLTSSSTAVDEQFFTLLNRLKRIHADCQVLLGSENQQLGLELMDETSRTLNNAFQKLFRWVQKEFKILDLENPRMNASIRRSLRVLAERPSLFQDCLDFFAEVRERNLSDAFYGALTGVGAQMDDRAAKPMEYYAHDSLRFVGDMLAWTHSASVSERESLEVLFISEGEEMAKGFQTGVESEPWAQENGVIFDGQKSLEALINRDLAGVSKALRQRIEQVIKSDEDPVLAYKISNLIEFYKITLVRLVGSESSVLENLANLQASAMQQYRSIMRDQIAALPADSSLVPQGLNTPDFMVDALGRLREIIKTYETSFTASDAREENFKPIMKDSLDPLLDACMKMASGLPEPSNSIFAINCLSAARVTISSPGLATDKMSEIEDSIDNYVSKLTDYQHAFLRQTSGLQALLVAIAPLTDSVEDLAALFKLDQFQTQQLTDSSQILDDFLPSALMDATENLKHLRDTSMAEEITSEAASRFCEDFDQVEERLTAADQVLEQRDDIQDQNGQTPEPLKSIFQRTSGEIRVLLS